MKSRVLSKLVVLVSLMLVGCDEGASTCGDPEIVVLASELVQAEIGEAFGLASLFNDKRLSADVTLSQFREYQKYDDKIHKRYCEASSRTKVSGVGQFLQLGLVLNGVDPRDLESGIDGNIKYSVQVTNDGTHLVGLEE